MGFKIKPKVTAEIEKNEEKNMVTSLGTNI